MKCRLADISFRTLHSPHIYLGNSTITEIGNVPKLQTNGIVSMNAIAVDIH